MVTRSCTGSTWLCSRLLCSLLLIAICGGCLACSATDGGTAPHGDEVQPSADYAAQAVLEELFVAWTEMDAVRAEQCLAEDRRGISWGFSDLDRVEFGPIAPAPERVDEYLAEGLGSARGARAEDVRCFSADVTFHYLSSISGDSQSGEVMHWYWYLERNANGDWQVTDWGY